MTSNFKELLKELEQLSKSAKGTAFRRAQIVKMLVHDDECFAFLSVSDEGAARGKLLRYTADLCVTIDELLMMLEFAPESATWESTPLLRLRDEAYNSRRRPVPSESRRPASSLVDQLREKIRELQEHVVALTQENRDLRRRLKRIERSLAK